MAFHSRDREWVECGEVELLRRLIALCSQLQSSLTLDAVAHVLAMALGETFGFRAAAVYLAEDDGELFHVHATVGDDPGHDCGFPQRPVPVRIWNELMLEAHRTGRSYYVDHRRHRWTAEQLHHLPPLDVGLSREGKWVAGSRLLVPLRDRAGELIGVLALHGCGYWSAPTPDLVNSLDIVAESAAVAIENAHRYERLERSAERLERQLTVYRTLLDLSMALLDTRDQGTLCSKASEKLKAIVSFDTGEMWLKEAAGDALVCVFTCGLHDAQLQDCRVPLDRGVLGWVLRHNEAQLVNDMARDPRTVHAPETPCGEAQASIIVPLRFGAEVMGVLCLNRHGGRVFSESDFEPVQLFADVAAIAIRNVGVYSELERRAVSDGLTGISNYRHFCEALASEVSRARRYGERFCLLMMDLDHFKRVNDTIGHQKGDDVLRAVTGVLRRCSRESDFLARYGGEEFVMILPNTGLSEAKTLAERIRVAVAEMEVDRVDLRVTISIGVAAFPDSAADADGVLGAADAALLRAKARGRNRVCVHCDGQDDLAVEIGGDLVELGSRFARFIGLSKAETQGLITALAVHETSTMWDEVAAILGAGGSQARSGEVRRCAVEALVYGNERWDGLGYPEGRRGSAIPRVARAFAVCRRYGVAAQGGLMDKTFREATAGELDPRMAQRFMAMLRAEKAVHN